ncbi:hypothetical protein ColKHC_04515 [Colletotrichum higginsianum]|nr:hypothetical protein ColKHC_04515 [Colletotrichum higginsianum]
MCHPGSGDENQDRLPAGVDPQPGLCNLEITAGQAGGQWGVVLRVSGGLIHSQDARNEAGGAEGPLDSGVPPWGIRIFALVCLILISLA